MILSIQVKLKKQIKTLAMLEGQIKLENLHDLQKVKIGKYTGFSEMEAIVAGTLGGAKACAMEEQIGSIEQGKLADIIVVDGDPLDDIQVLMDQARIRIVIKEGNIEVDRGLE